MRPLGYGGRRRLRGAAFFAVAVTAAICLAATAAGATRTHHARVRRGGTAYFAEGAQAVPNYIFPFMGLQFFSVTNISQFQQLMYRPLYWFGKGSSPALNPSLSLASKPTFSRGRREVSFTVKPWRWSNGERVTTKDVLFWMNMLKVEKLGWAGYAAGTIPDDVSKITTHGRTVTMKLTGPVNPHWYLYNELSQITPMPMAWDLTAKGQKSGNALCARASYQAVSIRTKKAKSGTTVTPTSRAARSCAAVYRFLSKESGFDPSNPKAPNSSLASYATNPLWQVVDGPWHLVTFRTDGYAAFKPNGRYSGPVKAKLAEFVELPFTSTGAEFNALVGGKVTVGYIPPEDITSPAISPTRPGKNNPRLAGKFDISPWISWGFDYFPLNFNSVGDGGQAGTIFKQLYFRQAFQTLVDQPLYVQKIYKNYGVPTYGPVPVLPRNPFSTKVETDNPYRYGPSEAAALLRDNGWKVVPNGTSTCSDAAKCGVPAGTPLAFTLQYVDSGPAAQQIVEAEQASWAQAGVKITLTTASFDTVLGEAVPCTGSSCTWEMEDWGGWVYAPDYYPSGEDLFQTGAGSNSGSYNSKTMDGLIRGTNFGTASLASYEDYAARNLPVVWQPNADFQVTEVQKNLHGVTPQNPLLTITPANWYFTK